MNNNTKYAISRWLIFISFLVAISGVFYSEIAIEIFPNLKPLDPHSTTMDIVGLVLCVIFVVGLYLGSRGLGVPLSFKLFIHLLFSYPSRFILVPYLLLILASIIYYEVFW
ncbi:MAG: hypothetical protein GY707_18745 [Desulfobacteraceae bacterium]|nr:hypothetical protein [Desulfobacteraceae bacterium]